MAQVDLGLTGLTRLIRSLALMTLIKNLGASHEEFRLREQQRLSPPGTEEYSSSGEEEEESDLVGLPPRGGSPRPPRPEPGRRWRRRCLGWALERPPPGN
jgi:hypothetical protein